MTENAVNGTTQNDDKSTHEASEHESDSEGSEGNSGDEEVNGEVPTDKKGNEQESESEGEEEDGDRSDEENEDEEEEDIPLSDLSGDERADVIPHQRLTINNSAAITASIKRISFITPNTPFSEHNSLVSKEPIDVPDPHDDLNRELAFYKVCQAAAVEGRRLLRKEGIPFSRPGDYFAEMVKSDEHMNKIKKKMYEEAAAKKAAAEAKRQRQLKKFGKQVQVAKLQQRQKEKRETLEKINSLKRSTLYFFVIFSNLDTVHANGFVQNARRIRPVLPTMTTKCSTLPSKKQANQRRKRRDPTSSARRRMRSTATVARNGSRNPPMQRPRRI